MHRFIKNLAPLVLVAFFFSVIIGPSWATEEVKVNMNLAEEDGDPIIGHEIRPDQIFIIRMQAFYKGERLKDIEIIETGPFKLIERHVEKHIFPEGSEDVVFKLKAPSQIGNYSIGFRGKNPDNEDISFEKEIKIVTGENPIIFIGKIIGGILVLYFLYTLASGLSKTG